MPQGPGTYKEPGRPSKKRSGGSLPKAKGGGSCGSKTRMKRLLKKRR